LVCSLGSVLLVTLTTPSTSWALAPHHVVCHSYGPVTSGMVVTSYVVSGIVRKFATLLRLLGDRYIFHLDRLRKPH